MLVNTSSQVSPQGYRPVRLTLPVPVVRAWDTLQSVSSFKFAISAQFSCGRDQRSPPSNPFLPRSSMGGQRKVSPGVKQARVLLSSQGERHRKEEKATLTPRSLEGGPSEFLQRPISPHVLQHHLLGR